LIADVFTLTLLWYQLLWRWPPRSIYSYTDCWGDAAGQDRRSTRRRDEIFWSI